MTDPRLDLGPQLTGAEAEQCQAALDSVRPIIRISPGLPPATAAAAAALVHLVGRIHPHVVVDGDAALGPNPWAAATVAEAAAVVPIPEATCQPERDIVIAIGDVASADLWVGGDDWTAVVSDVASAATSVNHALGLHAACCIAAAEILKRTLGPLGLVHGSATPSTVWNLLDYRRTPAQPAASRDGVVPPVALLGAGSVGSSIAAVLALSGAPGVADVVDPDTFDPSRNPYRYPASTVATSGPKAQWAASMLENAGWRATAHPTTVARWNIERIQPGFDGVALSSVDRVDARADVADVLARTTLSLGVAGLAFHVQREHPDDDFACSFCQYLTVGTPMSQLAVYEQQTGIPMARIAELLAGDSLTERDIEIAAAAGRVQLDRTSELVGRRLEDLVRRAYAQATLRTAAGAVVAVSAPAVSWLAAVIAAAEIRKAEKSLPSLDRRVDVDLSGVPTGITRRVGRDRSGRCVCANPFRVRTARQLYPRAPINGGG